MKKITTLQKSLMVIGFIGWSLSGFAQAYKIDRNKVFFDREPIPHADARSFVDLGHGYAKDRNNVYHHGRILEFVDPATFRLKGRDNSHFHEEGDWHEHDRSPKGYYKTKFNVYYGDKKIDAMASSFKACSTTARKLTVPLPPHSNIQATAMHKMHSTLTIGDGNLISDYQTVKIKKER